MSCGSPGGHIEYADFIVQVGPWRDGKFAVRVLESPAGQGGEGVFELPQELADWAASRTAMASTVRGLMPKAGSAGALSPKRAGEALFDVLFSGEAGILWARSLGVVRDRGLRLQLRFRLNREPPGSSLLFNLPWELLYQPATRDFLALSRLTPVVRYIEVPRPVPSLRLPSVLRILVVKSDVKSHAPLDLSRERRAIEDAWRSRPKVEVVLLTEARTGALREALLGSPFHVLHFMGHGRLDRGSGQGLLFFVGEGGASDPLSGEALATLLKDFPTLRLVILNACETARAVEGEQFDPFAGVATALVMGGIPAVVAMQFPVADSVAIAFSRTVHFRLAAGDPVDAAVTEGRLAVYDARRASAEWAIPALFTRVADGRLFEARYQRASDRLPAAIGQRPSWGLLRSHRSCAVAALLMVAVALGMLREHPGVPPWRALVPRSRSVGKPVLDRVRVGTVTIGRYEVAQHEYLQFVLANPDWRRGHVPAAFQDGDYLEGWVSWHEFPPGLANHPVTRVSWFAAQAFCRWLGGRLPGRQEWQVASHTAEGRFPWPGASFGGLPRLNFCDASCTAPYRGASDRPAFSDGYPESAPVDSFPAGRTREGVFNLSGNVWEWCADASGTRRLTLGGSYLATFEECSTDKPVWEEARLCAPDGGFRCVWD